LILVAGRRWSVTCADADAAPKRSLDTASHLGSLWGESGAQGGLNCRPLWLAGRPAGGSSQFNSLSLHLLCSRPFWGPVFGRPEKAAALFAPIDPFNRPRWPLDTPVWDVRGAFWDEIGGTGGPMRFDWRAFLSRSLPLD